MAMLHWEPFREMENALRRFSLPDVKKEDVKIAVCEQICIRKRHF
jgi:hypothetical protein